LYIATLDFPPAFYEKDLRSFIDIKDANGITIVVKENTLNFFSDQRDERLFFDEAAFGNQFVTIHSIVTTSDFQPMARAIDFEVKPVPATPPISTRKSPWAVLPFALLSALLITDGLRRKGGNNAQKKKKKR